MLKKTYLLGLLMVLVTLVLACGGESSGSGNSEKKSKPVTVYIAGTSGAEDTQSLGHMAFAKALNEKSGGGIAAEVKINGVLGETDDVTEQAIQGAPIINTTDPGRLASFVPEYGLIQLPYIFPDYTYLNSVMDTEMYKGWEKEFEKKGIKLLTSNCYSGARSWVTNMPVKTPADLKGVKIRTIGSDLFVNSVNAMGAVATALPWGETYQGIEQGVVDGCEAQIPGIYSMRFYEVADYVSLSEHFLLIGSVITGTKFFNSLSPEYQTLLMDEAFNTYKSNQDLVVEKSADYIKEMKAAGMTFLEIDKTPFVESVQPVYAKMGFSEMKNELYAELGL